MSGRIRWGEDADGNVEGFTGTLGQWAFKIWSPHPATDDEWVLVSGLPGQEDVRRFGGKPEALRPEAEVLLDGFVVSLGAVFPATLREQVQQARKDYYEQALDHGELTGHEEQEARAYGRVEMCDEVLGWLAGTGEATP